MIKHLSIVATCLVAFSSCSNITYPKANAPTHDSVEYKILGLRKLGFFEKYHALSDKQLLDTLHKVRINDASKMFEHYYDPGMDLEDSQIILLDVDRSVGGDTENDVGKGNERYVELIKDFTRASNGKFLPHEIKEVWAGEKGPITVSFIENNEQISFNPEYQDDWLSMHAFEVIEKQFEKKGNEKFYFYLGKDSSALGQDYLFVRMRMAQKDSIQKKFGWIFTE